MDGKNILQVCSFSGIASTITEKNLQKFPYWKYLEKFIYNLRIYNLWLMGRLNNWATLITDKPVRWRVITNTTLDKSYIVSHREVIFSSCYALHQRHIVKVSPRKFKKRFAGDLFLKDQVFFKYGLNSIQVCVKQNRLTLPKRGTPEDFWDCHLVKRRCRLFRPRHQLKRNRKVRNRVNLVRIFTFQQNRSVAKRLCNCENYLWIQISSDCRSSNIMLTSLSFAMIPELPYGQHQEGPDPETAVAGLCTGVMFE